MEDSVMFLLCHKAAAWQLAPPSGGNQSEHTLAAAEV